MLAWRAQCADLKTDPTGTQLQSQTLAKNISNLEEADGEDDYDEIELIIDLLSKQHGQQSNTTMKRNQRVLNFLQNLNLTMEDVYEVSDIGGSPNTDVNQEKVLCTSEKL